MKFGMLQVRENEISLSKCTGGLAHLCILEGTLVAMVFNRIAIYNTQRRRMLIDFWKDSIFKTSSTSLKLSVSLPLGAANYLFC